MSNWDKLVERQILKAKAEGQLEGLAGEGAPLPDHPGDALIDPAVAVGHRIMAEAGVLPREVALKAELQAAKDAWQAESDPHRKKDLMAQIAQLQMRYEIEREARRKFLG